MAVRLTNDLRQIIVNKAIAHAFDPKLSKLKESEDALGREAYAAVFTKAETDKVALVPENWIRRDKCLQFNVGGLHIRLELQGDGLPVPYRIGDYAGYSCKTLGVIEAGDLCDRIRAHASACEQHRNDRRTAAKAVEGMLAKVSTLKKLREVWPEGERFYAQYEKAKEALPTIRVDEINAALGLAVAA